MAQFKATIIKVVTNGPYSYSIFKDGVGQKAVNNIATIALALDGIKVDVAALLAGETVSLVNMNIISS